MDIMAETMELNIAGKESAEAELSPELIAVFKEFGIDPERINPRIQDRLRVLNAKTETLHDCINQVNIEKKIFDILAAEKGFSPLEQKTSVIGTIFSDIGKTGPRGATPEQRELITSLYAIENIFNPEDVTVEAFIRNFFTGKADELIDLFGSTEDFLEVKDGAADPKGERKAVTYKLDPKMTMRQFYNMHSKWTLDIINHDGVPPEAVAAAAAHHFAQGINPEGIIGEDGAFEEGFGENKKFDRAEKLIIVMDQYDARIRRSGLNHWDAIAGVRTYISRSKFRDDPEFAELIDTLEGLAGA